MHLQDFVSDKDFKKTLIYHINEAFEDRFSEALNSPIKELEREIELLRKEVDDLGKKLKHKKDPETGHPIQDDIDIYLMQADNQYDIYWLEEQLKAISEMKIVYLFKSLEIAMKKIIDTAYPNSNTKNFYRWESIKTFFKQKEIILASITGYREVIDLRNVNNSIKHTSDVSESIQNISEFSGEDMNHNSLLDFYERVKPKVDIFLKSLSEKVIEDLFVFDDSRLNQIAEDYFKRMNIEDANKLSDKLLSKYKSKGL